MTTPPPAHDSRPPTAGTDPEAAFRSTDALGTDTVGTVEAHGIDVIPDSERHGKPSDLFSFWLGSNVIFTYLLLSWIWLVARLVHDLGGKPRGGHPARG